MTSNFDPFGPVVNDNIDIKNHTASERRNYYQSQFFQLMHDGEAEKVKQLVNDKLPWEAFTLNDSYMWKLYEDNSFLAEIIRINNIELVDYCINLPQYKSHPQYLSTISHYIAYGFEKSASGSDLKALEYYENLHITLEIETISDDFGLKKETVEKENGQLVTHKYLFREALQNAVDSDYPEGDIIEFILARKDKYGAENCEVTSSDMVTQLDEESLNYNKFDTIRQHLGYEYDAKLFKEVYNIVKNDPRLHPSISFLVLEKHIEFTDEIKELVKDDIRVSNIFLYKKLDQNVEVKNSGSKIKL